jgi:hypothetical protein
MGTAKTCLVHGDQLDVGGRAAAVETVGDQRRLRGQLRGAARPPRPPRRK